jgi:DNA-binding SARP family transcriptional activator
VRGDQDADGTVRIEVLGPLRLVVDGSAVEVPGPKRRVVLALLARAQGRTVAVGQLIDALWPSDPPASARESLHSHICRLRGHLGAAAPCLETLGGGYRLVIPDRGLDARQAHALLTQARQLAGGDPAAACALLRQARALWRGPVLADLADVAPLAGWALVLEEALSS